MTPRVLTNSVASASAPATSVTASEKLMAPSSRPFSAAVSSWSAVSLAAAMVASVTFSLVCSVSSPVSSSVTVSVTSSFSAETR